MRFPVSELVTGLFVVIAIAVAVSLALATQGDYGVSTSCVAYFDDVALLEEGAQVAVNGHPVGKVERIRNVTVPAPEGGGSSELKVRVDFAMSEDAAAVLRAGSIAQIDQASLLGSKFLKILPATTGEALPQEDGRVLFATKRHFDMFATMADLKEKADELMEPAKDLLVNLNRKVEAFDMDGVNRLVSDADEAVSKAGTLLDEAGGVLRRTDENLNGPEGLMLELRTLTRDSDRLVNELREDLEQIRQRSFTTLDGVDELVATSRDAVANLDRRLQEKTLTEVERTLTQSQELMRSVDRKLETLTTATTRTLGNADELLTDENLFATMVEARDALRELKLLMMSLRANPAQVIFGGPGEIESDSDLGPRDRSREFLSGRGRRYDADK